MKVGNIFTSIAKSKWGQAFYKKISDPSKQAHYTNLLLSLDTLASTASYMYFTQTQKDIDPISKAAMQWQHVLSCIASIAICTPVNAKIAKFAADISKHIDPKIISPHKVQSGISILAPTCTVLSMNRCLLPAVLTPVSSVIRDSLRKKSKLNVTA